MKAPLSAARRILVVTKFRYMGDTIVATPFLRRLHEAAPEAEVVLLAGAAVPSLLAGCRTVSEVWTFDPKTESTGAMSKRIRGGRFDCAFLINRSLQSAFMVAMGRVNRRVGFDTEHRGVFLTDRVPYDWNKPDLECSLDLLRAIGAEADAALPELWLLPGEREQAIDLLGRWGAGLGSLLIAIHPGAHDAEVREWGVDRYAELADRLARQTKARIVLMGSADERPVCEAVAEKMRYRPIILAGETNLRQSLGVISLCRLWIGNDGGMLHAAVGMGTNTVAIFGPTKAPRWAYNTPCHQTLVTYPDQPASDPATIRRCLDAITTDAAFEAAMRMLERG